MNLNEFFDYKNKFMEDILTDNETVSLISDSGTTSNPRSLVYTQVFPYEYIPETVEYAQTFVCVEVNIRKVYNKTFLSPSMIVWVFTHKSKMKLAEGGVRVDKICSKIADAINGSRYYGLGELCLASVEPFSPIKDYVGKVMVFNADEFNMTYKPNKDTPSNRKIG